MKTIRSSMILLASIGLFLTGCVSTEVSPMNATVEFPIKFDGDCPSGPLNENASVKVGEAGRVKFVSDPAGKPFTLTFDPFVGRVYKAPQGQVSARISRLSLPSGAAQVSEFDFKFTIYSGDCTPVDPKVIVTR